MPDSTTSVWDNLASPAQFDQFVLWARLCHLELALPLVGWWHLLAFSLCYYLTIAKNYHEATGYLLVWVGEMIGMLLIFRLSKGFRPASIPCPPLSRFVVRVWVAYFVLAFNLGTMNTLRGHRLFELFPAMASLASFAFLVMTFSVSRRFFAGVLVMFTAGLLMSAYLIHAYLIFALAWWIVLNGIGIAFWLHHGASFARPPLGVHCNIESQTNSSAERAAKEGHLLV